MARSFETYEDYKRHLRNKWGQGEGRTYKPWFTTKDVKAPEAFRAEIFGRLCCVIQTRNQTS